MFGLNIGDSAAAFTPDEIAGYFTRVIERAASSRYGGAVTRDAGPVKGGTTVIAFVEDPDRYKIELIERRG